MRPFSRPRVKVCCIASVVEAWMAIEQGASAVGLVSAMPSGPGPIPEELIAEIAATIPPGVSSFLLTCQQNAAAIVDQQRRLRVNTIQICDRLPAGLHLQLHGVSAEPLSDERRAAARQYGAQRAQGRDLHLVHRERD